MMLPRPLTYLTGCVGSGTASLQHGVKCQLRLKIIYIWGGGHLFKYPMKNSIVWPLKYKVLHWSLTVLSFWVGFCTSSPQQGAKYQIIKFKKEIVFWGGFFKYPIQNSRWHISCPLGV